MMRAGFLLPLLFQALISNYRNKKKVTVTVLKRVWALPVTEIGVITLRHSLASVLFYFDLAPQPCDRQPEARVNWKNLGRL
jgi:hypothetical protein